MVAGVGIAVDTRTGYVTMILIDAATFLAAAVIVTRLAPISPVSAPTNGPRMISLRDRPFLVFTVLDGLMSMHFGLLNIALPLWIAGHTAAPPWLISVLLLVNTSMVVLVGALVHVIGELWQSAAGWGISFGLAPEHAHGQYQGTYAMGAQLGRMLAPVLVTTLAIRWGAPGWLVLAVLFAVLGALVPPVVGWASRTRPAALTPDVDLVRRVVSGDRARYRCLDLAG